MHAPCETEEHPDSQHCWLICTCNASCFKPSTGFPVLCSHMFTSCLHQVPASWNYVFYSRWRPRAQFQKAQLSSASWRSLSLGIPVPSFGGCAATRGTPLGWVGDKSVEFYSMNGGDHFPERIWSWLVMMASNHYSTYLGMIYLRLLH